MAKTIDINIKIDVFNSLNELSETEKLLCIKAKEILNNAYAPYSNFKVGAALLLENGEIITGTNQENIAYPSGTCAERTAIFYASTQFPGITIKAIAVTAKSESSIFTINKPVSPCGACRQVIAEYEQKQNQAIKIFMIGHNDTVYQCQSINDLLPLMFNK
ncbi:MAG: cytidine deaminase [Bacteroidetes bacterium]|nr:cytidine deaminase [Bacteroidota bacterium]